MKGIEYGMKNIKGIFILLFFLCMLYVLCMLVYINMENICC